MLEHIFEVLCKNANQHFKSKLTLSKHCICEKKTNYYYSLLAASQLVRVLTEV